MNNANSLPYSLDMFETLCLISFFNQYNHQPSIQYGEICMWITSMWISIPSVMFLPEHWYWRMYTSHPVRSSMLAARESQKCCPGEYWPYCSHKMGDRVALALIVQERRRHRCSSAHTVWCTAGISSNTIIKCGVKLLIHSQTSTVEPLKFGNG